MDDEHHFDHWLLQIAAWSSSDEAVEQTLDPGPPLGLADPPVCFPGRTIPSSPGPGRASHPLARPDSCGEHRQQESATTKWAKHSLRMSLSQAESPTKAAERAAAAWTPPPASTAAHAVDQVRARPRRSASSYAAYTAADTAAFEAAFGAHLAPPKDVSPPAASPAKVRSCLKSEEIRRQK